MSVRWGLWWPRLMSVHSCDVVTRAPARPTPHLPPSRSALPLSRQTTNSVVTSGNASRQSIPHGDTRAFVSYPFHSRPLSISFIDILMSIRHQLPLHHARPVANFCVISERVILPLVHSCMFTDWYFLSQLIIFEGERIVYTVYNKRMVTMILSQTGVSFRGFSEHDFSCLGLDTYMS